MQEKWYYTSLGKNILEEKIYKELEKKHETWEKVRCDRQGIRSIQETIEAEITREDIIKLTEKPVRRIYKLDIDELNDQI